MQKKLGAAIYARSATSDSNAIAQQLELASSYITKAGWKLSGHSIYVDDGSSGALMSNRPALSRLLSDIDQFDVVVVCDLSRISRNPSDVFDFLSAFNRMGKRIFCLDRNRELGMLPNESSKLAELINAFGEYERQNHLRRARFESTQKCCPENVNYELK